MEIEIDWERRRYEIAKTMLPQASQFVSDALSHGSSIENSKGKSVMEIAADCAVLYADALVESIKRINKRYGERD